MANANVHDTPARDVMEDMVKKLAQLEAMLLMTFGNASETFNGYSDMVRDNYLWACADISSDCLTLANQLTKSIPYGTPTAPQ